MTKNQSPPNDPNSPIAVFVKAVRVALGGISQEKLGERLGRTKGNVSHWEIGKHKPPYKFLVEMSRISGEPMPMVCTDKALTNGLSGHISVLVSLAEQLNDSGLIILIDKAEELVKKHPKPVLKTGT